MEHRFAILVSAGAMLVVFGTGCAATAILAELGRRSEERNASDYNTDDQIRVARRHGGDEGVAPPG
jgi:hypothetical protein